MFLYLIFSNFCLVIINYCSIVFAYCLYFFFLSVLNPKLIANGSIIKYIKRPVAFKYL